MGIDACAVEFLLRNRRQLGRTLWLGRQEIHVSPADERLIGIAERTGGDLKELRRVLGSGRFAEEFFISLGSSSISSMDISDFEGADVIHDLNVRIPDNLRNKFDCVYDGGTIEHIYNFHAAITNAKDMLNVGGVLYFINAANNMLGHGLYQFSPEVLWRMFSPETGFKVIDMALCENVGGVIRFTDAPDPEKLGRRNEISMTSGPTYIMMAAVKERDVAADGIFYQSDYARAWSAGDHERG